MIKFLKDIFINDREELKLDTTRILVNGFNQYQPQIVDFDSYVGNMWINIGEPVKSLNLAHQAISDHIKSTHWKVVNYVT